MGILISVASQFRRKIRQDDLESICDYSLFLALANYNPELNVKFSTYLYKRVRWQMIAHLRSAAPAMQSIFDIPSKIGINFREITDSLSEYEIEILKKRIYECKTLKEIGNETGQCVETIRKHILKIKKKIKDDMFIDIATKN